MTCSQGTLYGVGVGPGDPELLTLKAHRLISTCPVVAYPVTGESGSLALRIAQNAVNPEAEHIAINVPMVKERAPAQAAYDEGAKAITVKLEAGRDVVFLCEGDPFFYGSFMYLHTRLSAHFTCEIVPGVTSVTACAAALGRPLAARNDVLKVVPAPLEETRLRAELAGVDAAAIMKVGRHFEKVRKVLGELGLAPAAHVIEQVGHKGQKLTPLADVPDGAKPYFSTILIYKGGEPW